MPLAESVVPESSILLEPDAPQAETTSSRTNELPGEEPLDHSAFQEHLLGHIPITDPAEINMHDGCLAEDAPTRTGLSLYQRVKGTAHAAVGFISSLIPGSNSGKTATQSQRDQNSCPWPGLCRTGTSQRLNGRYIPRSFVQDDQTPLENDDELQAPLELDGEQEQQNRDKHGIGQIPDYVLEYAPMVYLYPEEQYWPCDMAEHLRHVTPYLGYTPIKSTKDHSTLRNLDGLNSWNGGANVFLTSNDDVESSPSWLGGEKNIPEPLKGDGAPGTKDDDAVNSTEYSKPGGKSDAPAVLIVIDKGDGLVDAFWFYFYSFNLGNEVLGLRFGNHVGDWEHTLVRFRNGTPEAAFFSEHYFGEAYTYEALGKIGKRPVGYSAEGSHAMYASIGTHAYVLPWGLLYDRTDRGPLWDPALNLHAYTYDLANDNLRASNITPNSPTEWFYYSGKWGDKGYPLDDERQYRMFGQYHYVGGPLGPRFKNLGRKSICQQPDDQPCEVREFIKHGLEIKQWWNLHESGID